jgi:serine/threonine-protein kinase
MTILREGDQFDHYKIRSHIAQGGMGDIYRAQDLLSGRDVALKIPNKAMIGDPAQFERFQRELEAMRTLQHPALQHGLESGRYNSTPFLVTELVEGQSLREVIRSSAPFSIERSLALTRKIADAMAYCHEHDIIHRDLKPENILVSQDDQPVILDFGLALTKNARRVTYANFSGTAGTPDYMAPEQVEGQRGDVRTDVYAVGTMLYEMIAGKPPFTGEDQMAIMAMHLHGAVPRLDKAVSGVSPQVATIAAKCMQRNPDDRYPDMRSLIQAIDHPETVDISILDSLSETPPATPFFKTQTGRSILTALGLFVVIVILTILLVALKH